jgi:hypothetical protein
MDLMRQDGLVYGAKVAHVIKGDGVDGQAALGSGLSARV